MKTTVGYFQNAHEGVYSAIREALPAGCELVTPPDCAKRIGELDVLIAGKVTREMIAAAQRVRLIQTPGVGYDGIDVEAAFERGVPVAYTICGNTDEVAEHTLLLMLAVSRRLVELDQALRAGRWMMWERRIESRNLAGKILGIVGLGRIGRAVARCATAFGMIVQYTDPTESGDLPRRPLDPLLETSDYVSLHVPLSPATRGLLGAARIGAMKQGAILINTARGEIVDEPALVEALRKGRLAGAGLDVFAHEPPAADHPLLALPNVVVTPHVASGTIDSLRRKAAWYSHNIERVMSGQEPLDLVPADAGVAVRR